MNLDNYKYLFGGNQDSKKYFMWYKNSLIITILSVVLTLLICYFVAYGLTMYKFRLQNLIFTLVIATMMVPFEILMLPMYKEIIAFGLIDTYTGVIITGLCSASTIFFFRQYMTGLPKELLSAAWMTAASSKNGRISGELSGNYKVTDGTNYIIITIGDTEYRGVMVNMNDGQEITLFA